MRPFRSIMRLVNRDLCGAQTALQFLQLQHDFVVVKIALAVAALELVVFFVDIV